MEHDGKEPRSEPTPSLSDEQISGAARLLPAFSVRRPVTTLMVLLSLVIVSVVSLRNIGLELIPSGFTPPFLFVQVPTLPSSPADVEQELTVPIEESLATLRNLDRMESFSSAESTGVLLRFRDGTSMDVAYNQVNDRVDAAIRELTIETGPYFIWKYNPNDDPLASLGITASEGTQRPELVVDQQLVPLLERISGVSRVEVYGLPDEQVIAAVDEWLARTFTGGMLGLVRQVQESDVAVGAGEVDSASGPLQLRVLSRIETEGELRQLPLGGGTMLGEIAQIERRDTRENYVYRINQRPGIFISVFRESSANVVDTAREVRQVLASSTEEVPALRGFDYHFFFDQGKMIEDSLGQLRNSVLLGGVLAVFTLFIFLRRPVVTLIVALSIPACLFLTVAALYASGRTLNVLSLTGMMLSVGLLVDNAIVVVEAIERRFGEGQDRRRAAIEGAAEVALPVTVSTLTTLIVFLPLTLMTGSATLTFYLSNIGFPVGVGLLASLFVSLVVVPLATLYTLRGDPAARSSHVMSGLERVASTALGGVLRRPVEVFVVATGLFLSGFVPFGEVARIDEVRPNINDIRVALDFDPAMTWDERVAALGAFEEALLEYADELEIRDLRVGLGEIGIGDTEIRAFLLDANERRLSREEITARLQEVLPEVVGVAPRVGFSGFRPGQSDSLTVDLVGPDTDRLIALSEDISERLMRVDGIVGVQLSLASSEELERVYRVDRERAALRGVSALSVGAAIDFSLRGREVLQLPSGGAELPVILRQSALSSAAAIDQLEIPGATVPVRVGNVSEVETRAASRRIRRVDRETQIELELLTTRDDIEALSGEIDALIDDYPFPRGYSLRKSAGFDFLPEGGQDRLFAIGLAILFVFLLVGILFESFVLPFAVLLSVPFAFSGVFWTLYLTGTTFDVMAAVGLLVLIGVVVNNAIVLVDYTIRLEGEGVPTDDALKFAVARRLRPILMTAATTVVGLLPMALGRATVVGIPYAPLGRTVIGGMVMSTLLTLFIVPLFYALITRARRWTLAELAYGRDPATIPK